MSTAPKISDALEDVKHSPTPWIVRELGDAGEPPFFVIQRVSVVSPLQYETITSMNGSRSAADIASANAAFIVKACNAHDELVEALKEALEYFESRADVADGTYGCPEPNEEMLHVQVIRAALAKAGAP